jgi:uncharacterized protein YhfF
LHRSHPLPTESTSTCSPLPIRGRNTDTLPSNASYTLIWNVLDYPACVFPVTKVDPVLDQPKSPHRFLNKEDEWDYYLCTSYAVFLRFPVLIVDYVRRFP